MSSSATAKLLLASPKVRVEIEGYAFRGRCVGGVDVGIYDEMLPPHEQLLWISDFDEPGSEWSFNVVRKGENWLSGSAHARRALSTGAPHPIYHDECPAVVLYFDRSGCVYVLATAGVILTARECGHDRQENAVAWCVPDGYLASLIKGHDPGFCPDDAWWCEHTGISTIYALE